MGIGQKLQILSVVLAVLAPFVGFVGSQLTDQSYLQTFKQLASDTAASRKRQRRHLDLGVGTLRLDPGMTKNGEGRVVYLTPELKAVLTAHVERVEGLQRELGREREVAQIIPWLFPHFSSRHRGTQRRDFRKAWATACRAAGVPGMLRHDFRRTAVRNMERTGVSRSVATKITGHKTEAVYRRYAIVSDSDLRAAAVLIADGDNYGDNRGGSVDARSLSV